MAKLAIRGIRPYDGEYELDEERAFNAREWRWIKRISGYMPNTVSEGMRGGDPDLYVALAVIAMARSGRIDRDEGLRVADEIAEAPFDDASITVVVDPKEDDADPPALTSEPEDRSQNGSLERQSFSGEPSRITSGRSDGTHAATTASKSDTYSELSQTELAS